MTKKRILLSAYAFYPEFGGLEQQMYLLAKEWLKLGHSVTILTEQPSLESLQLETIEGIKVCRLPFAKKRDFFSYCRLVLALSWFIVKNRNAFDCIHLRAALTLYPLVFGFWKAPGVIRAPSVVTADTGGDNDEIIQVKQWPLSWLLQYFFNQHNYLNSICSANYRHYLELGFPTAKLTTISNGVDISAFQKAKYPSKVKNFIFLGRLIPEKGLLELVSAMQLVVKEFPKTQLHIAGDGPLMTELKNKTLELDLNDSIHFHGKLEGLQKEGFFNLGECLVLPSYSEGLPLSVLEAAEKKYCLQLM
jgi:glycosyltransferase involved in cell wall biosynthesis